MAAATVLLIEDERPLVKILKYNLEKEGYGVLAAFDGKSGLDAARRQSPDLVILDVMLPGLDGFELLKELRASSRVPVLMLTARKEEIDRVLGLEIGADDYVVKPFSVREVLARVKAILRRRPAPPAPVSRQKAITLDAERYVTKVNGRSIALSAKEFDLLKCLLGAEGKALSREDILEKVWGHEKGLDLSTRTVDQHVARLRGKLGSEGERVVTVKGVGYRLREDP